MKHKIICIVLALACMYLPASSNECGKAVTIVVKETVMPEIEKPVAEADEISSLPASPFSRTLFNL